MLDVIKYFMRDKYKLIYQRDEYHIRCNDYEKAVDRKSLKIKQQDEELKELKKAYNLLKNIK